jgi:ATP-dependent DNA helicase PIF1
MELEFLKRQMYKEQIANKLSNLPDNIKLTEKQIEAFSLMDQGYNIFLTGAAGSGKTMLIKTFISLYKESKIIGVTSTTGISALLFGGTTLHSYLGIGLGTGTIESITKKIFMFSWLRKRWNDLETLVIDEISMLSPELFDKIEEIARIVRRNKKPFGGIQLILSGDFCQLPCVKSEDFCFEAKSWDTCINYNIYLTEIMRQTDKEFQDCLNNIRIGLLPKNTKKILESRIGVELKNEFGIKPTKLYSTNYSVDYINRNELDKLDTELYEYDMETIVYPGCKNKALVVEKHKKYCAAVDLLQLCVGSQVMLIYNMSIENGLVNGSRGVITQFINDIPIVRFLNGEERVIDYHVWEVEENDKKIMKMIQIPLKLAWAFTIHKIQGCTLDYAEIDLSNCFEYGMSYVALSRVKNLNSLSIIDIDFEKIKANPKAIDFYKKLI